MVMRIGVIVDGQSEFVALREIFPLLAQDAGNVIIGPVKADIQPKAPTGVIARACIGSVSVLRSRNVDSVIVLFDREDRPECPGQLAEMVRENLERQVGLSVHVVIKDRSFENWLISDPDAIRALPARFKMSNTAVSAIVPNKADNLVAIEVLQASTLSQSYQKVKDSVRILQKAEPLKMGSNSRSFRRFLRCIGHPAYQTQSRLPKA